eukprot:CAMPEP_0181260388 /NCGR_PEP_ID=MMETSP1097-20121128/919_1 /TAXON_ID=35684 /ORGANISM="Pseudopedinella elastica, Strain CCMP716" /LENGTH=33 /DNA_ID= /DNA_START= /DNA_END= /DNA_ORIENTATION=
MRRGNRTSALPTSLRAVRVQFREKQGPIHVRFK